jgi:hypothetical protein
MSKQVINRWGRTIAVGDTVAAHGANETKTGKVLSIDTRSRYARAYGAQLRLDTGCSVGADDVFQATSTLAAATLAAGPL